MVKIYIDPGHGGIDSGASGNGLLEKNVTLQIALAVRKYLGEYKGVSIRMSRTTDKTVTLKERTNDANSWGADYFLSIHINAGGGTGFESFIYSGLSNTSSAGKKRNSIHNKVVKVNGLTDRGKKQGNLHVLRESKMPSILTENGFIDTASDAKRMKNKAWIDRVGKAHAEGIADIYNLKKASPTSSSSTTSTTNAETYVLKNNKAGYVTALDAKNSRNRKTTVSAGTYYVYKRSEGMINLSKSKGTPGSWINPGSTTSTSTTTTFKVGDHVKIKSSAKKYATGETIPAWVKKRSFTIQKTASDRVLLKEITSWVKKSDITK